MPAETVRALVLRAFDFGETSQVVHLFTREQGLVHGMAKGSHRLGGSFHGGMDLLELGEVGIYGRRKGRDLRTLAGFEGITNFPAVRGSLPRFHQAEHMAALALSFVGEEQPAPEVFDLLESGLRLLEACDAAEAVATGLGFEAMLLGLAGFSPELTRCVSCERPARNIRVTRLSPIKGGLVCRRCRTDDRSAVRLSGKGVAVLYRLAAGPLADAPRLPADAALRRELREALNGWTAAVLDRRLRTVPFV